MSESLQNIELVERYFDDEMTEAEKAEFVERMKTDLELRHLFDRERLLINTVRFGAAKNNLEFLKDLDRSLPAVSLEEKRSSMVYYAVAASIILLIAVGIFIYNAGEPDPQKLYAEYFTTYPNAFAPNFRSEGASRPAAFDAYDAEQFEQAAKLFETLYQERKDPGVLLLLGNSNLASGNVEAARRNFEELINNYNDLDVQGKWYLSLCYLKEEDMSSARNLWRELADGGSSYAEKAKELLERGN